MNKSLEQDIVDRVDVAIHDEVFEQMIREKGFFVAQFLFWLPKYEKEYNKRYNKVKKDLFADAHKGEKE